jgi:hypothetical protein
MDSEGDAVLTAFAQAGRGADLADWVRRYPQYARDLTRLAAQFWAGEEETPPDARADARLLEIGRAVLGAAREKETPPLTSLKAAAEARGLDAEAVAARLHLPEAYFWKLHRRLFAPESLPHTLVAALAQTLDRAASEVAAYLRRPPTLAAGARYRAERTPCVGAREDFAATLQSDLEVTPSQRARWLAPDGE